MSKFPSRNDIMNEVFDEFLDSGRDSVEELELIRELKILMTMTDEEFLKVFQN